MSALRRASKLPHVSVVIPTQERREFLKESLASVRAQDYPALDILVAYGHSTDGTLEFLRENAIAHAIVPQPGIGAARNAGLAATSGEILYFLDDDDLMEPHAVSTLVAALLDADADLAYGSVINFLDITSGQRPDATADDSSAGERFSHLGETLTAPINSSTILRRSAFDRFGPMMIDNHSWARWYLSACDQGMRSIRLEDLIARRRIHDGNVSRRAGNYDKFFDLIRYRRPENSDRKGLSS